MWNGVYPNFKMTEITKPATQSEVARVCEIKNYLPPYLALLVNSYIADFSCKLLEKSANNGDCILDGAVLDNGTKILIRFVKNNLYLSVHKLNQGCYSIFLTDIGLSVRITTKITNTPTGKILIEIYSNNVYLSIFYLDEECNIIWSENLPGQKSIRSISVLNNDTLILRRPLFMTMILHQREMDINFLNLETIPWEFYPDVMTAEIIPYGEEGFIAFNEKGIYLYDDNLDEKELVINNNLPAFPIIGTKIICQNILVYAIGNKLYFFDISNNTAIRTVVNSPGNITNIHILENYILAVSNFKKTINCTIYDFDGTERYCNSFDRPTKEIKLFGNKILIQENKTLTVWDVESDTTKTWNNFRGNLTSVSQNGIALSIDTKFTYMWC
jgi:hypothetical protein